MWLCACGLLKKIVWATQQHDSLPQLRFSCSPFVQLPPLSERSPGGLPSSLGSFRAPLLPCSAKNPVPRNEFGWVKKVAQKIGRCTLRLVPLIFLYHVDIHPAHPHNENWAWATAPRDTRHKSKKTLGENGHDNVLHYTTDDGPPHAR